MYYKELVSVSLFFSPETDVYHTGMLVPHNMGEILIQLNPFGRDLNCQVCINC